MDYWFYESGMTLEWMRTLCTGESVALLQGLYTINLSRRIKKASVL